MAETYTWRFDGYRANQSVAPYKQIMNSLNVQSLLLKYAYQVRYNVIEDGLYAEANVRPGKKRAHARVIVRMLTQAESDAKDANRKMTDEQRSKAWGFRNRDRRKRLDLALQRALDSVKG